MNVWIVCRGYDLEIQGVYSSLDAAKRHHPRSNWEQRRGETWFADADRNDFLSIIVESVQD